MLKTSRSVKPDTELAELWRVRQLVRNLPEGESLDVQTGFVDWVYSRIGGIDDGNRYAVFFSCSKIPGGLRITCQGRVRVRHPVEE